MYNTFESQASITIEKKLCFICLKSEHLAKNCNSKLKCFQFCEGHHSQLCQLEQPEEKQEVVTIFIGSPSSILSQTTKETVKNPDSILKTTAGTLFASGSQLSYVILKLARQLM